MNQESHGDNSPNIQGDGNKVSNNSSGIVIKIIIGVVIGIIVYLVTKNL